MALLLLLLMLLRRLGSDDVGRRVTVHLVEHQRDLALSTLDLTAQLCQRHNVDDTPVLTAISAEKVCWWAVINLDTLVLGKLLKFWG